MNKAQRIVIILGVVAIIYLLVQFYFFYSCPIGVMCSANKQELSMRMIIVIAATAAAVWLLKSDTKIVETKPEQPAQPVEPSQISTPAEPTTETNPELPNEG